MAQPSLDRAVPRPRGPSVLVLAVAAATASCGSHSKATTEALPPPPPAEEAFFDPPYVRGTVVDMDGSPVKAKVAVVEEHGGSSSTTRKGPFTLPAPRSGSATLIATTDGGRLGWRAIEAGEEGPISLTTDQVGAFLTLENGLDEGVRVAVFYRDVRLHDFTLHPGEPETVVVPVGNVRFGLTGPPARMRQVAMSEAERVTFQLP